MIEKLIIKNFRSIKEQEINFDKLNAFVGPNNAGKSNIMRALNLILGESWPSVYSFNEKDFYNYDKLNEIEIEVTFDSQLICDHRVYGFRLTFDGTNSEYFAIDNNTNVVTYNTKRGQQNLHVSNEMKDEVSLMYLGLDRQASQQIRATQGTLYGKLLRRIEKQMEEGDKNNFKNDIQKSYKNYIYATYLKGIEEDLKNYVREQTGLDLCLRLSIFDPIETIKNLKPYLRENQSLQEFDAEDMGAGVQSALAIAIARTYAKIVKQPLIIAIEEPELYLHPHGCRHFYRLLKELSKDGVQIIYTTHERSFVNVSDFQSIHLVKKESGETKVYSTIERDVPLKDEIKLASKFDEGINEVFFANQVVLVEGVADKIACQFALEKLGMELDKESISIIECGGNKEVKPISEVLRFFNIPTYALIDEDPDNSNTKNIILQLKSSLGDENVFLQRPGNLEGMFGLHKKFNRSEILKSLSEWFERNEPPDVYKDLKERLKKLI
ncbi:MAG: AAA family ATPase [Dictyoglomaceae bacterium]